MGISTRGLFKMKKWTLAIQSLPEGLHNIKLTRPEYDALRVVVNRENKAQDQWHYILKKSASKFTIYKTTKEL